MPVPLTTTELSLVSHATQTINSIPRFTKDRKPTDHTCACAVLSSTGRIFTGVNTPHFTGGPCAETIAFGNATLGGVGSVFSPGSSHLAEKEEGEGEKEKETLVCVVAVLSDERGVISPCGRCRQVMWDMHPGIRVIVQMDEEGREEGLRTVGLDELLPFAYTWIWKPREGKEKKEDVEEVKEVKKLEL